MDLVPVDHDPFANAPPPAVPNGVTLQPVDHDPWAPYVNPETGRPEISVSKAPAEGVVAKSGRSIAQPSVAEQVAGFPQRAADMTIGALGPIGEAGMTVGDMLRTGHVDPRDIPQIAGGVMLGVAAPEAEEAAPLEAGAEAVAKGITAYHGSPYDFDKFDLSKIGTGEGTQAYGHGLYFAENPAVAEQYKESLTPTYYAYEGQKLTGAQQNAATLLTDHGMTKQQALDYIDQNLRPSRMADQKYLDETAAAIKTIDPTKITKERYGKTYQVSINADPEHFLDWDKPLSEQSPVVQNALTQLGYFGEGRTPSVGYQKMAGDYGGPDMAATMLHQAGIPGIKYLDQGSRGQTRWIARHPLGGINDFSNEAEAQAFVRRNPEFSLEGPKQTKNYVVFDDKLIDIIKKYGLAGLIAGGASHFATQPVDHDPFAAQSP